jgi:hypothetical protein
MQIDLSPRREIGVFDSGVGGFTVLRELHALLPTPESKTPISRRGERSICMGASSLASRFERPPQKEFSRRRPASR